MIKKKFPGVYFRASEGQRMNGGKTDICFSIRYKNEGRQYLEKVGWQSEGYSAKLANIFKAVHDQALLSLHCGLRVGEIFNLRGQDLDLENGLIRIMDSKNKANRTAYMNEAVRDMLKERFPEDPNGLIFKDRDHEGEIKSISKTFDRTVNRLGFNNGVTDPRHRVVFRTLHHTFASWLALEGNLGGNSILTIKEILGH